MIDSSIYPATIIGNLVVRRWGNRHAPRTLSREASGAVALDKRNALLNFALDIRFAPLRQLGSEGFKSRIPPDTRGLPAL